MQIHHVEVRNGEGAYDAFLSEIRRIFCITEDHDMQLAFDCADPVTGAYFYSYLCGMFDHFKSDQP